METIRLKNGTEEVKGLVATVMASLNHLLDTNPIVAYDLVMVCRDSNYKPFGNNGKKLAEMGLVDVDGRVHDSIRNVVLSSVSGEGLNMTFGSPAAK